MHSVASGLDVGVVFWVLRSGSFPIDRDTHINWFNVRLQTKPDPVQEV